MLRTPDVRQRGRVDIIDGLDRLLDNGMAGGNHVAFIILAILGIGQNVQFPWLCIYEFPPKVLIQFSGKRMHFIIILIHKGRESDLFVGVKKTRTWGSPFFLVLPEKEVHQLIYVQKDRDRISNGIGITNSGCYRRNYYFN